VFSLALTRAAREMKCPLLSFRWLHCACRPSGAQAGVAACRPQRQTGLAARDQLPAWRLQQSSLFRGALLDVPVHGLSVNALLLPSHDEQRM
jgi:hypothetical protein